MGPTAVNLETYCTNPASCRGPKFAARTRELEDNIGVAVNYMREAKHNHRICPNPTNRFVLCLNAYFMVVEKMVASDASVKSQAMGFLMFM